MISSAFVGSNSCILADGLSPRRSGVAFDDGEVSEELRCAAVPVHDFTNRVIGTLGISGPSWRLSIQALHKNSTTLKNAAERLSSELGFRHTHDAV